MSDAAKAFFVKLVLRGLASEFAAMTDEQRAEVIEAVMSLLVRGE